MLNVSGWNLVLVVVVGVAMGILGYYLAEADRRTLGRTPWGLAPLLWALFWFLSPLVGLVLWLIAHRAEVRRAAQTPFVAPMGPGPATAAPARASASDFPAYPRPADGGQRGVPPGSGPGAGADAGSTPAGAAGHGSGPVVGAAGTAHGATGAGQHVSPPAWHPDPSGRFHYRWWTGSEWTSYVSVHGHVQVDTNPDQRIGPYS